MVNSCLMVAGAAVEEMGFRTPSEESQIVEKHKEHLWSLDEAVGVPGNVQDDRGQKYRERVEELKGRTSAAREEVLGLAEAWIFAVAKQQMEIGWTMEAESPTTPSSGHACVHHRQRDLQMVGAGRVRVGIRMVMHLSC